MRRASWRVVVVAMWLLAASPTRAAEVADFVGRPVVEVQLYRDGQQLQDREVAWSALLIVGSRCGEILRAAEGDVDLIVVSSHRVNLERRGVGASTLSYQIAVLAPCPVLLVK